MRALWKAGRDCFSTSRAIEEFKGRCFLPAELRRNAARFSGEIFRDKISRIVAETLK